LPVAACVGGPGSLGEPGDLASPGEAGSPDASASRDASTASPLDASTPEVDACRPNEPPISASGACGSESLSVFHPPDVCAPELHFVSIYEASSDHSAPCHAIVYFDVSGRGSDAVLVLCALEAVTRTVNVGAGSSLAKVIVLGYRASTVVAAPGVEVDNRTPGSDVRCSHEISSSDPCVAYVQDSTGGTIGSMSGCYRGTNVTLE